jgi:NAD+ kinase
MKTMVSQFRTVSGFSVQSAGIITKKGDGPAILFADKLGHLLKKKGIDFKLNQISRHMDILIILGGDGTLLHIAADAARHSIPVIGINLGHLGFLTELTPEEAEEALERIIQGTIVVENRLMLKAGLIKDGKNQGYRYALNDVVINKNSLDRVLHLRAQADEEFITTYKADGLIISTPTGSTAYNLSAGGPLVYPGLASILVTPICPFMLSSRPVLLPADITISVKFDAQEDSEANIIIDGQAGWKLKKNDLLEIGPAEHPLQLIVSPHKDYFAILRNKLRWGIHETSDRRQQIETKK